MDAMVVEAGRSDSDGLARRRYVLRTPHSRMKGPTRPLPITEPRELAAALKRLDERERRVLELRYCLRGERQHVLAEVGGMLGVSPERARQLESRALSKLGAHRDDREETERADYARALEAEEPALDRRSGPEDRRAAIRPWARRSPGRRTEDALRQDLADAEPALKDAQEKPGG